MSNEIIFVQKRLCRVKLSLQKKNKDETFKKSFKISPKKSSKETLNKKDWRNCNSGVLVSRSEPVERRHFQGKKKSSRFSRRVDTIEKLQEKEVEEEV